MDDAIKFFTSSDKAMKFAGQASLPEAGEIEKVYPTLVNSYYLSLTDFSKIPNDPIFRQWHPDFQELTDVDSSFDPLSEEQQMPVSRLIHRYKDRALLLITGRCAMRCRFCFRKRHWANGGNLPDLTEAELEVAAKYIEQHPEIHEVLLSGGDPLTLSVEKLELILERLTRITSLDIIRLGSRIPVVMPMAVSDAMVGVLKKVPTLWLATHFNHPREVTPESSALCLKLVNNGIPVVNQTVLLKGVNDSPEILEELFRKLIKIKVKPHYLFHVDPVRGVRHFATGIEAGLEIIKSFRAGLSSLAVPTFAIDLPEGGGKVALQNNYLQAGKYPDIHNEKLIEYKVK